MGIPIDNADMLIPEYIHKGLGQRFDPGISEYLQGSICGYYGKMRAASGSEKVLLWPDNAREDEVLFQDSKRGTGRLLQGRRLKLGRAIIQDIKLYRESCLYRQGVYVSTWR